MSASRPPCWPSGTVLAVTLRGGRSQSHRRARAAVSPSRASQSPAFGRRSSHESSWHSLLVNWASEPVSLRHPGMGPEAPAERDGTGVLLESKQRELYWCQYGRLRERTHHLITVSSVSDSSTVVTDPSNSDSSTW